VSFLSKVKDAFNKLKSLGVKQKYKDFGIRVVEQLLQKVGLETKSTQRKCPPRVLSYSHNYTSALIFEMRVDYCEPKDIERMNEAVRIVAKEAEELTPVDTGRLRDSQYTLVFTENGGKTVVGVVGYDLAEVRRFRVNGNMTETVFYALAVHTLDANHELPPNPPRATFKFLELAAFNTAILNNIENLFK
jgi:hypothetical protein